MHTKQRNEAIRHVVAYIFTIVMVFLAVTPFIYVVLTALNKGADLRPIADHTNSYHI